MNSPHHEPSATPRASALVRGLFVVLCVATLTYLFVGRQRPSEVSESHAASHEAQPPEPRAPRRILIEPSSAPPNQMPAPDAAPPRLLLEPVPLEEFLTEGPRLVAGHVPGQLVWAPPEVRVASRLQQDEPAEPIPPPEPDAPAPDAPALDEPTGPRARVPLENNGLPEDARIEMQGELVSLSARDAKLSAVLSLIAEQQGLSIVSAGDLSTLVTVTLHQVSLDTALEAVVSMAGCTIVRRGEVVYVSRVDGDSKIPPHLQGRTIQTFTLNFLAAADLEKAITGLLSPAGKSFIREVDEKNSRKTQDQIVVEDLPEYVSRIAEYIARIDQPPRQVLVEAHVLQIRLQDDLRHGVNLTQIARLAGARMTFDVRAFANPLATPASFFTIDGTDLDALVEALRSTTDAKTLASPRVAVVNGQQSKIQIGKRLGYFVTTTTQTSTLQDVRFLEVGVVLDVTPIIADDNRVMMKVKPKVSSGAINPTTTLPEEETTEVETSVILASGEGLVIGGLIQESDSERQAKIPFLGDLWLVGRLFQRRSVIRERSEVIVTLVPRIVPYDQCFRDQDEADFHRARSPLMTHDLERLDRPEEGQLYDAIRNPQPLYPPVLSK